MTRSSVVLAIVLGLAFTAAPAAAKKPRYGVFGVIDGKKFKAPSTGPDDVCMMGTYQASGGLVFTAEECRGKRHRIPRRNLQIVVFVCGVLDPPRTPPYEASCLSAVYSEVSIKHHVATQKLWTGSVDFGLGPDGMPTQTSSVHLRVDSFDGTYVRGAFSGVFDQPQQPGSPAQAPISGEVQFYFPVRGIS